MIAMIKYRSLSRDSKNTTNSFIYQFMVMNILINSDSFTEDIPSNCEQLVSCGWPDS